MYRILLVSFMLLFVGCSEWRRDFVDSGKAVDAVSGHELIFDGVGFNAPSKMAVDGPLLANGSMAVTISGDAGYLHYWISRNDFWQLKNLSEDCSAKLFGGVDVSIPQAVGGRFELRQSIDEPSSMMQIAGEDIDLRIKSWVAATDDLLVIEVLNAGESVEMIFNLWAADGEGSDSEVGIEGDVDWAVREFKREVWVKSGSGCALRVMKQGDKRVMLNKGDKKTVVVSMASGFDGDDYLERVISKADGVNRRVLRRLRRGHVREWKEFWGRSMVVLNNATLQRQYDLGKYIMACGSDGGGFAVSGFGPWVTSDDVAQAGYDLEGFYQSAFYPMYSSNYLELSDSFDGLLLEQLPNAILQARKFGDRGAVYPPIVGPRGLVVEQASVDGLLVGVKALVNVSMKYYGTYDVKYAQKMYPVVRSLAVFWEDKLEYAEGEYSIKCAGVDSDNLCMAVGLVKNLYKTVFDMAVQLGVDVEYKVKWEHIANHMQAVFNGECVGVPIYPGSVLGLEGDEVILELERISENLIGENGFSMEHPEIGICTTVTLVVNELLLESHGGVIGLFAGWPKDRDAEFLGLRAYGAFLVSGKLSDGEVSGVKILSEQGRYCVIQNPWAGEEVVVKDVSMPISRDVIVIKLKGDKIKFATEAGKVYSVVRR